MANVDAPFVIGVIRQKEKGLLQQDEYTRIVGAPTADAAVHSLADTPYAMYLEDSASVFEALEAHLYAELKWLESVVNDERVLHFITARHDGVRVASALMHYKAGRPKQTDNRKLSSISKEVITSVLWDNIGHEDLPDPWREFIRAEREKAEQDEPWSKKEFLLRMKDQTNNVMNELAFTPMMREIASLYTERQEFDMSFRDITADANEQQLDSPSWADTQAIEAVTTSTSAIQYEYAFDAAIVDRIRTQRTTPIGYDPIVAYWMAKELEVRTLRLVLSAKFGGLSEDTVRSLIRPLYLGA